MNECKSAAYIKGKEKEFAFCCIDCQHLRERAEA